MRVGCCGWGEAKDKYFAHFPAVELQSTFYDLPSASLAAKWRGITPAAFRYCVKAWQLITHPLSSPTYRKLKARLGSDERDLVGSFQSTGQVRLAWDRTAEIARILDAAVVLFQCPASFMPESKNLRNLRSFFTEIDRHGFALAWEPRGNWPSQLLTSLCEELNLLLCVDPFQSSIPSPYWRLHGRGGYRYRYSDGELESLRSRAACERPQYVFFNNIWMKDDALRFQELAGAAVPR